MNLRWLSSCIFLGLFLAMTRAEVPAAGDLLKTLRPEHPRLLVTDEDLAKLKKQVADLPEAARWFGEIRKNADKLLTANLSKYVLPDGKRLLATSRTVKERVLILALTFRLTGEPKYRDRLWAELDAAAHFQDWNPKHFLDTAEMTNAFGLAYDWLYADWSPEQRTALRSAIKEKGLLAALPIYQKKQWWTTVNHNWNQVCNGGISIGALAIAEDEPALAGEILHAAVTSLPASMQEFAPDGCWGEGPNYWAYATEYSTYALAAFRTALGTDFGLSDLPGFSQTAGFPAYFTGPTGLVFNYADGVASFRGASQIFWLAKTFHLPGTAAWQMSYAAAHPTPLDLVWGADWIAKSEKAPPLPLARAFRRFEVATARSAWNDPRALFFGIKAGSNSVNHSHLDLGSFVFDALGQRWAVDLGSDDYNLPDYFGKKRWEYYRLRAEGHNTLVLNPAFGPDQNPKAMTTITAFQTTPERTFAVLDLTPAYAKDAQRVTRGIALLGGKQLLVEDEVKAEKPADLWWFFHTTAEIELAGKSATLSAGGEKVIATILSPANAEFSQLAAEPLPASPHPAIQGKVRKGDLPARKLAIHLPETTETRIVVLLSPQIKGPASEAPSIVPLADWK